MTKGAVNTYGTIRGELNKSLIDFFVVSIINRPAFFTGALSKRYQKSWRNKKGL